MKLVIDNNVLFSIINPKSVSSYLFSSTRAIFLAPEFIGEELDKYKEVCLFKSRLSKHEFEIRKNEISKSIKFFEEPKYENLLIKAIQNLPDPKDSPYLALALSTKSSIWSNDPHLKQQSLVKVYTTKELVKKLLQGDL